MTDAIIDGTTFDLSLIKYLNVKSSAKGGKTIGMLNSKTNKSIFIETPLMLSWGMQETVIKDSKTGEIQPQTGPPKYTMALQCPSRDGNNDAGRAFFAKMAEFEQKILQDAFAKSTEWFGESHDVIQVTKALMNAMLYHPKLKEPKGTKAIDPTRDPTFKISIPIWDDAVKSEIYNLDGDKLFPLNGANDPRTLLPILPRGDVKTIIQCGGIYIINGKWGVTWKLHQALVSPRQDAVPQGVCLIKVNRQDREKLVAASTAPEAESEADQSSSLMVGDTDDEADPAPAPAPVTVAPVAAEEEAPKPTRKVIKKKAV